MCIRDREIINNTFVGKQLVTEANFNIGIDLLQQFIDNDDLKISSEKHIRNLKKYLEVIGTSTWKSQLNTDHLSSIIAVSYTHLRAHETVLDLVCRLLLEKKKRQHKQKTKKGSHRRGRQRKAETTKERTHQSETKNNYSTAA